MVLCEDIELIVGVGVHGGGCYCVRAYTGVPTCQKAAFLPKHFEVVGSAPQFCVSVVKVHMAY